MLGLDVQKDESAPISYLPFGKTAADANCHAPESVRPLATPNRNSTGNFSTRSVQADRLDTGLQQAHSKFSIPAAELRESFYDPSGFLWPSKTRKRLSQLKKGCLARDGLPSLERVGYAPFIFSSLQIWVTAACFTASRTHRKLLCLAPHLLVRSVLRPACRSPSVRKKPPEDCQGHTGSNLTKALDAGCHAMARPLHEVRVPLRSQAWTLGPGLGASGRRPLEQRTRQLQARVAEATAATSPPRSPS